MKRPESYRKFRHQHVRALQEAVPKSWRPHASPPYLAAALAAGALAAPSPHTPTARTRISHLPRATSTRSAPRCCACTTRIRAERGLPKLEGERAAAQGRGQALGGHGRQGLLQPHQPEATRRSSTGSSTRGYVRASEGWTLGENLAWGTGELATPAQRDGGLDGLLRPPAPRSSSRGYREVGFGIRLGVPQRRRRRRDGDRRLRRQGLMPCSGRCCSSRRRSRCPSWPRPRAPRTAVHARHARRAAATSTWPTRSPTPRPRPAVPDGLGPAWCGDERTSDDTAHAAYPRRARRRSRSSTRYAADRPNRFAGWARRAAGRRRDHPALPRRPRAAGTKAIRFDMGTRCGPEYVGHPDRRAARAARRRYAGDFRAISERRRGGDRRARGPRNAIILADALSTTGYEYGLGETMMGAAGERPGAVEPAQRAAASAPSCSAATAPPRPARPARGWWPEGFLHEITHTLGAVQWGAPHSTAAAPAQQDAQLRPLLAGRRRHVLRRGRRRRARDADRLRARSRARSPQSYDCGRDDYFNPAPPPGQLPGDALEHVRLGVPGALRRRSRRPVAAATSSAPTPPAGHRRAGDRGREPPRRAAAGRARARGSTRRTRYAYQWQRQSGRTWRNVSRATEARYVAATRDLGRRLRVIVTATNADGITAATSEPTAPVGAVAIQRTAGASRSAGAGSPSSPRTRTG